MDEVLDDRRPQREGGRLGEYVLIAVFAVITIIFVMPLAVMVLSAFKPQAEILRSPPSFWPEAPTLDNFQRVLSEAPYLLWYRNSLVVAIAVTAIAVFTSAVGGYIFAKFEFPLKQPLFVLVLATLMIPFPVLLIPNYIIANRLGVLNSLWALILPGMVSAFGIFLMRQFAAGIPRDLIEAARLDGAGEWAIFGRIVLPLLRPALAALGVFTFLASWNDYLWPGRHQRSRQEHAATGPHVLQLGPVHALRPDHGCGFNGRGAGADRLLDLPAANRQGIGPCRHAVRRRTVRRVPECLKRRIGNADRVRN
jgi:multiple sugar transport system permease protein